MESEHFCMRKVQDTRNWSSRLHRVRSCPWVRNMGLALMVLLTAAAVIIAAFLPRIPQDPAYHRFADQRTFMGIHNFLNVISNLPFVVLGYLGVRSVLRRSTLESSALFEDPRERWSYVAFYFGAMLTGFGSAFYHLWPDNDTLLWDRLAMTVVFMSFVATIISERISIRAGFFLLLPALATGGGTVIFWILGEHGGVGDLRPYILVQYYPMMLIPLILIFFPSRYTRGGDILTMMLLYGLAKVAEVYDTEIFALFRIASGHTLKHLLAGAAVYVHLKMLTKRELIPYR